MILPMEIKQIPGEGSLGGGKTLADGAIIVFSAPCQLFFKPLFLTIDVAVHFIIMDMMIEQKLSKNLESHFAGVLGDSGIVATNLHQMPLELPVLKPGDRFALKVASNSYASLNFSAALHGRSQD